MGSIGAILSLLLGLAQIILLARVAVDWAVLLAGPPSPGSIRARITAGLYTVTEPVLAPVRRVIPPLRFGGVGIDIAFLVVFIGLSIVRSLVSRL
jgi:YggT family protein